MASMSLQAAYDQARQWLESNDLNRAIGLAQYILEQYPDNLDAYRILGEAYLANRQLDRAQESFERVLRSDPENIPAHVGLGITYERQGRLDRAVPEFEQALEIKPDMPELRSQLLRLYTDAWGSEHAHLRLSRAGLARLYAKGHMLPQAISEFRQVIAEQPNRFDAMVAMAEALWRDGQEDAAIAVCRDILAKRPESLKANLILGYLEMAAGHPEGEQAWAAAHRMDPYQVVAHAILDTLPPETDQEPMIEEWDEAAWHQRRAEEEQERIAATRPMEAVTPVGIAAAGTANGSRGAPPPPSPRPTSTPASDDFLAGLLAINTPPPPPPVVTEPEEDFDLDIGMAPFSLDDLDGERSAPAAPATPATPPQDEPTMSPFSLSDLGLSDDEIAGLESLNEAPTPAPEAPAAPHAEDEPTMSPFSLSDLGLSDDEIAGLESLNEAPTPAPEAPAAPPTTPLAEEEPTMSPFSLSDLGLSDDEIASLDAPTAPAAAPPTTPLAEEEPTMSPFSLSDLGLSDDEIASLDTSTAPTAAAPSPEEDDMGMAPFSLSDLGLSDDEITGLGMASESLPERPVSESAAASDTTSEPPHGTSSGSNEEAFEGSGLPVDLQPFSLDELDLATSGSGTPNIGGLGSSLQPFSFDEPPQRPRVSGFMADESFETSADEQESIPETGGFSWQEPTQKPQTSFLKSPRGEPAPEEGSIFSKLKQRHQQEGVSEPPQPPPPVSIREDEHLGLFSLDNISLRDDEELPEPTTAQPTASMPEPPAAPPEVDNLRDAIDSGQVQPFSLADLGLSEEEIAALGLGDAMLPSGAPDTPAAPESLTQELTEPQSSTEPSSTYALDDLEPVASEPVTPEPAPKLQTTESDEGLPSTGDLQPFSLTDLGLSEEEIIALGLDSTAEPEEATGSELGITEEELEGLDLGDIHWNEPQAAAAPSAPTPSEPPAAEELGLQVTSGDLLFDRLIALGREQGYVDISDIMAGFDDPEAEAARIEELGQRLHAANIEIRDGDEVIDMDAEYAEAEESPTYSEPEPSEPAPRQDEEPVMTPFSLADLGLSDEEIASLGLADAAPAAAPTPEPEPAAAATQDEEPVMTPFSLADLGLSDAEIAALGMGEATAPEPSAAPAEPPTPEPEPAAAATQDEEPVMTPFSLADLGLSDAEIAALGMGEATAPEAVIEEPEAAGSTAAQAPVEQPPAAAAPEVVVEEPEAAGSTAAQAPVEQPPAAAAPEPEPAPVPPVAPVVDAVPPKRPAARVSAAVEPPKSSSGNEMLDAYMSRLNADPENHVLRRSIARAGGQLGRADFAVQQYRYLIKQNALLDHVVDDLQDLISDADDQQILKRLHRTLGDAYTKQGRLAEAMDEYCWTPAGS